MSSADALILIALAMAFRNTSEIHALAGLKPIEDGPELRILVANYDCLSLIAR